MSDQRMVIVTGGASGIGEGIVRRFAGAGDRVCILDLNAERGQAIAAELAPDVSFHQVDTSDRAALEAVANEIGHADVLVPCAGLLQNAVRVLDMDLEEAERLLRINYLAVLSTCQVFGLIMKARGSGAIVTIASLTSMRASAQVAYNATKASVMSLTESMAAELGQYGIRVNAVAPGYTLTPAMQDRIASGERDPAAIIAASALKKWVLPEDVANAVYFLCSDQASAITGVTLPIDAGWLAYTAFDAYAAKPPPE